MKHIIVATALMTVAPFAATAQDAIARIMAPDGSDMGDVTFTQTPNGVIVEARLSNVPEGAHGFHVHQTGSCEDGFAAAGDHYNPDGTEHGMTNENGPHAGDLPNVFASADGTVNADVFTAALSVGEGDGAPLMDDDGSAVIVHESPDTYEADAGAGGRIGCGVIEAM